MRKQQRGAHRRRCKAPDDCQVVGYLFVNGRKVPLTSCEFDIVPTDAVVDRIFATLPDGADWRGNRQVQ